MNYEEFKEYTEVKDNNFVKKFVSKDGHEFFMEPAFYTQLMGLQERYPEECVRVVEEIKRLISVNDKLAFVYDFENPFLDYGDIKLREFVDITDSLKIFYEDKSRGSDYGD